MLRKSLAASLQTQLAIDRLTDALVTVQELALICFERISITEATDGDIRLDVGTGEQFALRPNEKQKEIANSLMQLLVFGAELRELHKETGFPGTQAEWEMCARLVHFGKQLQRCELELENPNHYQYSETDRIKKWFSYLGRQRYKDVREPCLERISELRADGQSKRAAIASVAKQYSVAKSTLWKWMREVKSGVRMVPRTEKLFKELSGAKKEMLEEMASLEQRYASLCLQQLDYFMGFDEESDSDSERDECERSTPMT